MISTLNLSHLLALLMYRQRSKCAKRNKGCDSHYYTKKSFGSIKFCKMGCSCIPSNRKIFDLTSKLILKIVYAIKF